MFQTIVKIDLCGSKSFYDNQQFIYPEIRKTTLDKLKEVVQAIYPYADNQVNSGKERCNGLLK